MRLPSQEPELQAVIDWVRTRSVEQARVSDDEHDTSACGDLCSTLRADQLVERGDVRLP